MRIENCQKKPGEKQRKKNILYLKQFEEAGVRRKSLRYSRRQTRENKEGAWITTLKEKMHDTDAWRPEIQAQLLSEHQGDSFHTIWICQESTSRRGEWEGFSRQTAVLEMMVNVGNV